MRIVFMGTPTFAATILEELIYHHEIVGVYTRPDAVRGRGKKLQPSPVKEVAEAAGIPVFTPRSLRDPEEQQKLAELQPEVICVAAYGYILPKEVLHLPPFGCLNVHASLLPRWRGAAPIEHAILAGDKETGVCIMRMEEGMDTGAYCVCRTVNIEQKSASDLTDELANLGAQSLLTGLAHVEAGTAQWTEQDESRVTFAPKIEKGQLDPQPTDSSEMLLRKVQASSDAHPSRCVIGGRGVTLLELHSNEIGEGKDVLDSNEAAGQCMLHIVSEGIAPGKVRFINKRLFLGCTDGAVEVLQVKPDGKQAMDAKAFAAGLQALRSGEVDWTAKHA